MVQSEPLTLVGGMSSAVVADCDLTAGPRLGQTSESPLILCQVEDLQDQTAETRSTRGLTAGSVRLSGIRCGTYQNLHERQRVVLSRLDMGERSTQTHEGLLRTEDLALHTEGIQGPTVESSHGFLATHPAGLGPVACQCSWSVDEQTAEQVTEPLAMAPSCSTVVAEGSRGFVSRETDTCELPDAV